MLLVGCEPSPLTLTEWGVDPAGSCSAHASPRQLALGAPTGVAGGASPHCGSRADAGLDYLWVQARSSDRLACPTTPGVGGDKADDASEGRGDRVRFASRSPMASELVAYFLGAGSSPRHFASRPPLADVVVGS